MRPLGDDTIVGAFVVFCRVGGCLGLAPGFSSARVPMRARLLIALALSIAIYAGMADRLAPRVARADTAALLGLILSEFAVGAMLGLMSRLILAALETMGSAASMATNLSSSFGPRPDDSETLPELSSLIVFVATFFLFVADAHWTIIRALVESYDSADVGFLLDPGLALSRIAATLSRGFMLAFGVAAPFIVFGVVSNVAFGLLNKIAPQIATYFVAAPFVIAGALFLVMTTLGPSLFLFTRGLADWIAQP